MHGQKRNNLFLIVYISLALLLLVALLIYVWAKDVPTPDIYTPHPQVEAYHVQVSIKEIHIESRVLVVDYEDSKNIIVGLLSEGKVFNTLGEEITLAQIQSGDKAEIEVKFIGTNSILVSEIRLRE